MTQHQLLCRTLLILLPWLGHAQRVCAADLTQPSAPREATTAPNTGLSFPFETIRPDPPLSLNDAEKLLRLTADWVTLHRSDAVITSATRQALGAAIQGARDYAARIDHIHPSLPQYTWQRVLAEKVPREGWGTLTSGDLPLGENVNAIGLNVHNGAVELRRIILTGGDGARRELTAPRSLVPDLPGREVVFLPVPMPLRRVEVECRQGQPGDKGWPRVFLELGTSPLPETARQADYVLGRAIQHLRAGQFAELETDVDLALELLSQYRMTRRL